MNLQLMRNHWKHSGMDPGDISPETAKYWENGYDQFTGSWQTPAAANVDFHLAESLFFAGYLERREVREPRQQIWFRQNKEAEAVETNAPTVEAKVPATTDGSLFGEIV